MKKIGILSVFFVLLSFAVTASAADDEMVLIQHKDSSQPLNLNSTPARASAQMTNDATATSSMIRMSGLFLIALGCGVGGAVLYFRRRSATTASTKQSPRLSIQERLSFGPNREFILLKACDRVLVLAAQNGQMVLLTDMASEEPLSSAPAHASSAVSEEVPLTYESVLTRATRRLDKTRPATPAAPQTQSWPELAELNGVMR